MRESEVIAEMTIISQLHDTPRSNECRGILEEHEATCSGVSEVRCDALTNRFIERCAYIDTAARANVTAVWKGQIHKGENFVNFATGGFWRMDNTGGSCIGPIELLPGDQLVFCGNLDDSGELVGAECNTSPAHEPYREKWHALREVAAAQPENLNAQIALAAFLEEWNDRTGALAAYDRIRRLSPNDPRSFVGPGRILFAYQQKREYGDTRYEEAIALFHQALDLDPKNAEAHRYLNRIRFLIGEVVDVALVDFETLKFRGRNLDNLDLRGKSFAISSLTGVTFRGSKLDGADFTDASLDNVDFSNASLRDAVFVRSPKATYSDRTRFTLDQFAGADLTNARFEHAWLDLDLAFSDVSVSVLLGANLKNADLHCGDLSPHYYEYTGRTKGEVRSVEREANDWPPYWASYIENLRTIREIARMQPVVLTPTCSDTLIHYLSLPDDCRPWLPADERNAACTFMK